MIHKNVEMLTTAFPENARRLACQYGVDQTECSVSFVEFCKQTVDVDEDVDKDEDKDEDEDEDEDES